MTKDIEPIYKALLNEIISLKLKPGARLKAGFPARRSATSSNALSSMVCLRFTRSAALSSRALTSA